MELCYRGVVTIERRKHIGSIAEQARLDGDVFYITKYSAPHRPLFTQSCYEVPDYVELTSPVTVGQTVIKDILGCGVDVVVMKDM